MSGISRQTAGEKAVRYIFFLVLIGLTAGYALFAERNDSLPLIGGFFLAFLIYLYVSKSDHDHEQYWFVAGTVLRLILFISLPILSDDFYRFIWDGRLLNAGINPFAELPAFYLDKGIENIDSGLYTKLNSPGYFTIYPPLNQLIFLIATWVFPESILGAVAVMRIFVFFADLGNFYLLRKLARLYHLPTWISLIYYLNPLIILEFTGNLHFESIMIFFTLLFIYCLEKGRIYWSASAIGMAVISKLLPLMYLPVILRYVSLRKAIVFYILAGLLIIGAFMPLVSIEFLQGLASSLDLYFRKFEFNASVYFILRAIGFAITGYNEIARIGPLLGLITLLTIVGYLYYTRKKDYTLPRLLLTIHLFYLLFATTVHPWYVTTLVALTALTNLRYALLWSLTIFFTYVGYREDGFSLPDWVLYVEYISLFAMMTYEMFFRKSDQAVFLSTKNSRSAKKT